MCWRAWPGSRSMTEGSPRVMGRAWPVATSDLKNPQSAPSRGWTWPLGPQLAQAALEKSPSITYIYDVQAERSVFQNRRFAELLGHAANDGHAEDDWRHYVHDEDALAFSDYQERLK